MVLVLQRPTRDNLITHLETICICNYGVKGLQSVKDFSVVRDVIFECSNRIYECSNKVYNNDTKRIDMQSKNTQGVKRRGGQKYQLM